MIIEQIHRKEYQRVFKLLKKIGKYYIPSLESQINSLTDYVKKIVDNSDIFIAVENEDIGLLAIYCNDYENKKAFITSLGIDISYNGKGIAQALFNLVLNHLKKENISKIELEVNKENFRAIGFYKRNGFLVHKETNHSMFMELELI